MPETPHAIATRTGNRDVAALLAWLAELHEEPPEHAAANAAACEGLCRWCQNPCARPLPWSRAATARAPNARTHDRIVSAHAFSV